MADDWASSTTAGYGSIVPGDAFFANIETTADHDWFQIHVTAGKSYVFSMRGADSGDGTLADPFLSLRDSTGSLVTSNNDSVFGLSSTLIWVAPQTGTYYLDAGSNLNTGTGVYTLGMEEQTDLPGNASTPVTLDPLFSSRPDLIETSGDKDWYRVELTANTKYVFDLVGLGYRGMLPDGKLTLYRDNGDGTQTQVKVDDNSGFDLDARIVYTAPADGTYYLQAASADGQLGFYWMYAAPAAGPNYMDSLLPVYDQWWPPDAGAGDAHWTITWNFMAFQPSYAYGDDTVGFAALDSAHRAAVESALAAWGALTNIDFVYVGDSDETAQIRFGSNHGGASGNEAAGYAFYPDQDPEDLYGSDVYFNNQDSSFSQIAPGQYGYLVMLHEIGHALGLKHPGDYNAGGGVSAGMGPFLPAADDTRLNTVMSYNQDPYTTFEPTTPMLYDIDAIQWLYGVNTLAEGAGGHAGASVYTFSNSAQTLMSIWDPSGIDTFNLTGHTEKLVIDLREFHMSSIGYGGVMVSNNVGIANGSVIEKAIGGSAADSIIGNPAKNTLTGNGGNDTLDGGTGADLLRGGAGNDTLVFDKADLTVAGAVQGGAGTDTLILKGAGKTLDLITVGNTYITDIEQIDIKGTGNNTLKVSAADVNALNTSHTVYVIANAGDHATLTGTGWAQTGTQHVLHGNVYYDHWSNGTAQLYWAEAGVDIVPPG